MKHKEKNKIAGKTELKQTLFIEYRTEITRREGPEVGSKGENGSYKAGREDYGCFAHRYSSVSHI